MQMMRSLSPCISIAATCILALCSFSIPKVRGEPENPPWHLDRLDQFRGVDSAPFRASVVARTRPVLYVIDSGINRDHTEFKTGSSKVLHGYNFIDNSWDSSDCMGHGTHVAALAAGAKYGVAGSIGVDIISVRILDCNGRGSCSSMIKGLEWVYRNHSDLRVGVPGVVVMSIGSRHSECEAAHVLTESLAERNIIVIAAAGNSGSDACMFHPASAKGAITVGAFELKNAGDNAWSKTNFGDCVDIFAPGTSMAAPLVAGQALLIIAAIPGISVYSARKIIEKSASRGTLLGSQIDPEARGSRVARVPWLKAQPSRVVRIPPGDTSMANQDILSLDTVTIALGTRSTTFPAVQYAIEHIATNLHSCLKKGMEKTGDLRLSVECHDMRTTQVAKLSIVPASQRVRGWDYSPKNEEAGFFDLGVACNISSDPGIGSAFKALILKSVQSGCLRCISGHNATLLSEPTLRHAPNGSEDKQSRAWKVVAITISGIGLAVACILAVVMFCRYGPQPESRNSNQGRQGIWTQKAQNSTDFSGPPESSKREGS